MKLPRNISGIELAKKLKVYGGYTITRQTGSHIRLTTDKPHEHHITIPAHNPLRVGTMSSILNEVAKHFNCPKDQVINDLWK